MKIPNSVIELNSKTGESFVRVEPAYYAMFYKQVWGPNATDGQLAVHALPIDADESFRYKEVASVEEEARHLIAKFSSGGNTTRGQRFFERAFPDGVDSLREAINKLISDEAKRIVAIRNALAPVADPSWEKAGISAEWGIALQKIGFKTRADCVGKDLVDLCRAVIVNGSHTDSIDIEMAAKLSQPDTKVEKAK